MAVLLVGDEERRLDVPRRVPPRGAREGHGLTVELDGDRVISAAVDVGETERARKRIADRPETLRGGEHRR